MILLSMKKSDEKLFLLTLRQIRIIKIGGLDL
jgi:hypothetical protein